MNLKLEFNEVIIEDMKLRTEFLLHRLLKQDVKILLLTDYHNKKLDFRKKLKITKYINNKNIATYENTYFDIMLAGKNYKGIYFGITDGSDNYIIPIDFAINNF